MLAVAIGWQRRFGALATEQQTRIQSLPLADLEALADALLDFQLSTKLAALLKAEWQQTSGDHCFRRNELMR